MALAIDPKNTNIIYAGIKGFSDRGDGGVIKSTDGGITWSQMNNGLTNRYIQSLAIDPQNTNIIYAGVEGGSVYRSTDGGQNWAEVKEGLVNATVWSIAIDPANTRTIYAGIFGGGVFKYIFPPQYIIKALTSPGGFISPSGSVTVNYGADQTFIITPNTGYKIKNIKVDGVSVGPVSTYTFTNVTADHTIEAQFEPITFTITASSGVGGTITPAGTVTVNYSDSKIFTITPNSGYKISDVKVDGKSVGAVSTYTFSNITDNHTIEATFEKNEIVIVLQVGQTTFTVNGSPNTLDSPPIIKNGRTLLPIRLVVEALGGTVGWDATEKKVTVTLGSTTIELWIGKNTARVNGIAKPIDSSNPKVVPEIINGRTMLPLRFVAENIGCELQWDPNTQTITITYRG